MRLLSAFRFQLVLQFRHGFYYAYAVVCALYIALLLLFEPGLRSQAAAFVIFSDPAVLGFFFIGGIILLEKDENTLQNLFVTPIRTGEYVIAKDISLSLLAVLSSGIIAAAAVGFNANWAMLLTGVLLTSVVFIHIGIAAVSRIKSLNKYMLSAVVYMIPLFAPILDYYGIVPFWGFRLFPTWASITLVGGALSPVSPPPGDIVLAYGVLAGWAVLSYFWAVNWIERYVIGRKGGRA